MTEQATGQLNKTGTKQLMAIKLSDQFTYRKLLRYVFPTVVMMVFSSVYGIVDGLFVSNFAGKEPFAAINLVFPALQIIGTIGFMLGTGGGALVGMRLGEGQKKEADELFSMLVIASFLLGAAASVIAFIFAPQIARLLGAEGSLYTYSVRYIRITLVSMPMFILEYAFQTFFITAEKPKLGLGVTVLAGCMNILLDFLLVGVCGLGLDGAAWATVASEFTGGLVPVAYFIRKNSSLLRLVKTEIRPDLLIRSCINGAADMLSGISSSAITILYNHRLLRLAGTNGVAAYSAILYIGWIFFAILHGYSVGSAPIVSYHYGEGDRRGVTDILKKSLVLNALAGILMTLGAEAIAVPFARLFVGYDAGLFAMTLSGVRIHALGFLFLGLSIYITTFLTAIGYGKVSSVISAARSFVFPVAFVLLLPCFMGLAGVWASGPATETLGVAVAAALLMANRELFRPPAEN